MKAYLIMEDGTVYTGKHAGAEREVISEIVFNTSMTGYQEVLTDPSYAGQAVVMTYPLIGNYGVNPEDMESASPWPDGLILRELSRTSGSWRSEENLQDFLVKNCVAAITGIDTRDLTRKLRNCGTMNGCITTRRYEGAYYQELIDKIRNYSVRETVRKVSGNKKTIIEAEHSDANVRHRHVALMDFGTKKSIVTNLVSLGCDVTVYPADTCADEIIRDAPDGIMLSNGPGDPKENTGIIREIKILLDSGIPVFAICLGHQMLALAAGADTYKLKYGHRGGNHPVKDLETGRVYISSQNHGYAVDASKMKPEVAEEAFINVNDGTNEGFRYVKHNALSVQFHPEASPGPHDTDFLFGKFMKMMDGRGEY